MLSISLQRSWFLICVVAVLVHDGWSISEPTPPIIIGRQAWGARPSKAVAFLTENQPLPYVFIHHFNSKPCFNQSDCASEVRAFQRYHMDVRGWNDIGYSFVIGGDGSIFMGRGWDEVGAHTLQYNNVSLGISLIGDFQIGIPTEQQLDCTHRLIAYGVSLGKFEANYSLLGHRDVRPTLCPGQYLYSIIRQWPHYGNHTADGSTTAQRRRR